MVNLFLFLSAAFLFIFLVGMVLEKIRIPWIFAALFLGIFIHFLAPVLPFLEDIINTDTFTFLANLGMYFLLFIIGFEINLNSIKKQGKFIAKSTTIIILLEAALGTVLVHFIFGTQWLIALLVAASFATVGEAMLVPILDEFKIINTRLGETLIGVGTLDDIIEMIVLMIVVVLVGSQIHGGISVAGIIGSLLLIFLLAGGLTKINTKGHKFNIPSIESLFFFVMMIVFLFLGIGNIAETTPLAALLAGVALGNFIPKQRIQFIETEVKAMAYGFFAPIFFLWVGSSVELTTTQMSLFGLSPILAYLIAIVLVVAVSKGAKLIGSYIAAHKELGVHKSLLLGVGLSVRFSTSIVLLKIMQENALIGSELFSVLIVSSIAFKFIVPALFSNLLVRWGVAYEG